MTATQNTQTMNLQQSISDLIYDWEAAKSAVLTSTNATPDEIREFCREVVYHDVIEPDFRSNEPVILRQVMFGAKPIAQLVRRGTVFEIATGTACNLGNHLQT